MSQIQENVVVMRSEMAEKLSSHFPVIECPNCLSPKLRDICIFSQWFLTVSTIIPTVNMCDYEVLMEFEKYLTFINSKKHKNIKKTKEMFPYLPAVEGEVKEKKKRISKKKEDVIGPDGEVVVPEKKKRIYKKKESNVEVSDGGESGNEATAVAVTEKKKRISKKKEVVEDVIGPNGEVVVTEKKKRVSNKKEVVSGLVESGAESGVESGVESGGEKKKKVSKKVTVKEVTDGVESGVEEKKTKINKKKVSITEDKDTNEVIKKIKKPTQKIALTVENQETIAKCMQVLQDMEELEMEE